MTTFFYRIQSRNAFGTLAFFMLLTFGAEPAMAASHLFLSEYQIKAAYLYNFSKFVEWPEEAFETRTSALVIGIYGEDPFKEALDLIRGKTVGGRKLQVRTGISITQLDQCHMVFVSRSHKARLDSVLRTLKSAPVLTISDMEGFAAQSGMVQLLTLDNKIRFIIHHSAARKAGLQISSKLLSLAHEIAGEPYHQRNPNREP